MFEKLGWWEIACLALLALFLFGPDRLPKLVRDGVRILRRLRAMAHSATQDFRDQLGPDVELQDLHPKRLISRHLLSPDEVEELRTPFRSALGDDDYHELLRRIRRDVGLPIEGPGQPGGGAGDAGYGRPRPTAPKRLPGEEPRIDPDAT